LHCLVHAPHRAVLAEPARHVAGIDPEGEVLGERAAQRKLAGLLYALQERILLAWGRAEAAVRGAALRLLGKPAVLKAGKKSLGGGGLEEIALGLFKGRQILAQELNGDGDFEGGGLKCGLFG
jgi:hypothetical protein